VSDTKDINTHTHTSKESNKAYTPITQTGKKGHQAIGYPLAYENKVILMNSIQEENSQSSLDDYVLEEITQALQTRVIISGTEQKQSSKNKKFNGSKPNVLWTALSKDELLKLQRFIPADSTIVQQRTEEWHNARRGHITGSSLAKSLGFFSKDINKLLNLSVSKTYRKGEILQCFDNLYDSCGDAISEKEYTKVFQDWGTNHETNALITFLNSFAEYSVQETGFWSSETNEDISKRIELLILSYSKSEEEGKYMNNFLPRIGASPDGLIIDNKTKKITGVLEIKCPSPYIPKFDKEDNFIQKYQYIKRRPHKQVPMYYLPQIMTQMFVTNLNMCLFCSWTATAGMNVFEIEFDPKYMYELLYWTAKFNSHYLSCMKKEPSTPMDEDVFMKQFLDDSRYTAFIRESMDIVTKKAPLIRFIAKSSVSQHQPIFYDSD
jgi:hypothetical protein